MLYLVFVARLYHGIGAATCQAERKFSTLAHLIGDMRRIMLASKVERMMFIRLNRNLIDEIRELNAAVAQARARVVTILIMLKKVCQEYTEIRGGAGER